MVSKLPGSPGCGSGQGSYAALTIASHRYLALARVTASSFLQHNPGVPFYLLLADAEDDNAGLMPAACNIIKLDQLQIPEPDRFRFQCTELEFSYALTPFAIDYLLRQGFDGVMFLKQETLVLDELASVFSLLNNASVLLTPHFLEPTTRADAINQEINVSLAGIFNGGLIAFANCKESERFLSWWQSKTRDTCVRDLPNGLHFEQRWLDFAPGFMPRYRIIRDPGVNVGHWNLPDRQIRIVDGKVSAKGVPCRVFRFSGYDFDKPEWVTKHNTSFRVADTGDASEIFSRYRRMILDAGHSVLQQRAYGFDKYDNGIEIEEFHRRVYRQLGSYAQRFGNPFSASASDGFYQWLSDRIRNGMT